MALIIKKHEVGEYSPSRRVIRTEKYSSLLSAFSHLIRSNKNSNFDNNEKMKKCIVTLNLISGFHS